jgi:hypothetical protein
MDAEASPIEAETRAVICIRISSVIVPRIATIVIARVPAVVIVPSMPAVPMTAPMHDLDIGLRDGCVFESAAANSDWCGLG